MVGPWKQRGAALGAAHAVRLMLLAPLLAGPCACGGGAAPSDGLVLPELPGAAAGLAGVELVPLSPQLAERATALGADGLALVEAGLALAQAPGPGSVPLEPDRWAALALAAEAARSAERGLFAPELAPRVAPLDLPLAGVALPMHHKQPHVDYAWELAEVAELGAEWVNLIVVTRQAKVDSSQVPLTSDRTPSDGRILATIRAARALGLRVQLMPVVLIAEPGPEDWRGTLAPADRDAWWRSYGRFLGSMADLARQGGAELLCVGSELASMEADEARWRWLIGNLRQRFGGHLTYSANWDHFAELPFWDALDLASMTGYFEVCKQTSFGGQRDRFPDLDACLRAGWRAGQSELRHLAAVSGLPAVFSEVGLPSVEGALARPWDYTLEGAPDPDGQARAFEAFRSVFLPGGRPAAGFGGAFLYDYWGAGGLEDTSYTPRGKPAAEVWQSILAGLAGGGD
jgi:hypothetical protein